MTVGSIQPRRNASTGLSMNGISNDFYRPSVRPEVLEG